MSRYAEIVFPLPLNRAYTYIIPDRFLEDVVPGCRVLVPFGPRKTTGFIVSLIDRTEVTGLKEIEEVLDPVPLFTARVLELARWISDYYLCGWGEVLKAALPAGIHLESERMIRLVTADPPGLAESLAARAPRQAEIVRLLAEENPMPMRQLLQRSNKGSLYSSLRKLREAGFVRHELSLPGPRVRDKYESVVRLPEDWHAGENEEQLAELKRCAPAQARCMELLLSGEHSYTRTELLSRARASSGVLTALAERGLVRLETRRLWRDYYGRYEDEDPPAITPNPDQRAALEAICRALDLGEFTPFLLHGVTGSGKTQVYIEAIHHVLKSGRTAIVLVPEIALTPQMVRRFRSHFRDRVAVFHSRMSPGERYDSWRRTWEGGHQIVIGPRSAIFSPVRNLGLVVVDEEHEPSYKQADITPRYSARDVAVMRARIESAAVVLGSATPSVESYFNASIGKYRHLELPRRIDDVPMPPIEIVDMRHEPRIIGRKDPLIFSRTLRRKIDDKLSRGEQIILLQNRRGFATLLKCQECSYTENCPQCDITLTFHLHGRLLRCHYCGYTRKAPVKCPQCGGSDIFFRGIGTQRVEEELHELFPGVEAVRMDLDTTKGRMAHDRILSQFGAGKYQVLLGTQMVAKGLDFPNVTLVGVISADTELLFPDFRAGERTFQLVTQVAGRAGRKDKAGEVVIQTFSPDHYSLYFSKIYDYIQFFKTEIGDRRELGYPPYSRMVNILFKGPNASSVQRTAERLAGEIVNDGGFTMLGPAPAVLSRIQGNFRWQILFKSLKQSDAGGEVMKNAIRSAMSELKKRHRFVKVSITIDVDPISIL